WELIATDNNEKKIQLLSRTPILRFKSDIMIQVVEEGESIHFFKKNEFNLLMYMLGSAKRFKVHMRSKSRLPMSDFGCNACCIRQFFDTLAAGGPPAQTGGKQLKQF